jgi:hypothetical protein
MRYLFSSHTVHTQTDQQRRPGASHDRWIVEGDRVLGGIVLRQKLIDWPSHVDCVRA